MTSADPVDFEALLLLAEADRRLGRWEASLAALEAAASLVPPRSGATARLVLAYAACLPAFPDRGARVVALARLGLLGG